MLRVETVEKGTLDIIQHLLADEHFRNFNLVGGTALALSLGHRKSIDIDLFSAHTFDAQALAKHLLAQYKAEIIRQETNAVFCFIDSVKTDLICHQYPIIDAVMTIDGIRMVSLREIGAMKLNAIYGNGSRLKDFVDLYYLLEKHSLQELIDHSRLKYPDMNPTMTKYAVIHHAEIKFSHTIDYIHEPVQWEQIAKRLKDAFYHPHTLFTPSGTVQESEAPINQADTTVQKQPPKEEEEEQKIMRRQRRRPRL